MEEEKMTTEPTSEPEETKKPAKKKAAKKKKTTKKKAAKKTTKKVTSKKSAAKKEVEVNEEPVVSKKEPAPTAKAESVKKPTFSSTPKKKKSSGGIFGYILLILLLLVIIAAGTYYQTQVSQPTQPDETKQLRNELDNEVSSIKDKLEGIIQQMEEQKKEGEEENLITYENQELGIRFSYPAELGDYVEDFQERTDPTTPDEIHKAFFITFSANPDITIDVTSTQFPNENGILYTGTEEALTALCPNPLEVNENGYCDLINFAGQNSIERALVIRNEVSSAVLMQSLLNLPGTSGYYGLVLQANLGAPPVAGRNLFAPSEEVSPDEVVQSFLRNTIKGEGLSLVVLQNLEAYEKIRDHFEILTK